MKNIVILLLGILLISSCSVTNKSKRKLRRADKLIKEARIMSPSLFDTVYVIKRETLVLTRDSLITQVEITVDTLKVDSLLNQLVELRNQGVETDTIVKLLYREMMPELTYTSEDSIKIFVEEKVRWLKFSTSITLENAKLKVITKPLGNVTYTVEKAVVTIDAKKVGRFWRGVLFGVIGTFILLIVAWVFRGAITTGVKGVINKIP
jgi:hypothetical protein